MAGYNSRGTCITGLCVCIEKPEKLHVHGAGDGLRKEVGEHHCASHVGERHDFTRDQVAQEFCCAKNVLRLLERDRIKGRMNKSSFSSACR